MRLPEAVLARIEEVAEVTVCGSQGPPSREQVIAGVRDVDGVLSSTVVPVDAEVLEAGQRLRVVSNFGVGFDHVDVGAATERGILVTNTPDVLTDAVADLTLGLMLALARRIVEGALLVREGRWIGWNVRLPLATDLRGKTLAIIGLGRIGAAVARRAQPFGLSVIYHDVRGEIAEAAGLATYRPFDQALREADIVSLHVNLTPETTRLIGARELALMKPVAFLVNTSRGPVVDQRALYEALRDGRLAGAALDVTEPEPPDPADPLLQLSNVLVVPHIGSATRETRAAMLDLAVRNLVAGVLGQRPPCLVNPEVWSKRRTP